MRKWYNIRNAKFLKLAPYRGTAIKAIEVAFIVHAARDTQCVALASWAGAAKR